MTATLLNRGRQFYPVRVEAVRELQRLDAPLFIDPGPPRIILARWDPMERQVITRCSGDGGLDPEELGLAREEYAQVVYGERSAAPALRYLIAAVLTRCLLRERLAVSHAWLCRRPWVPPLDDLAGVDLQDSVPGVQRPSRRHR